MTLILIAQTCVKTIIVENNKVYIFRIIKRLHYDLDYSLHVYAVNNYPKFMLSDYRENADDTVFPRCFSHILYRKYIYFRNLSVHRKIYETVKIVENFLKNKLITDNMTRLFRNVSVFFTNIFNSGLYTYIYSYMWAANHLLNMNH